MKKKQTSFAPMRKPVADDAFMQSLTGEETWEQIQQLNGFRHFVLFDEVDRQLYLGPVRETNDGRQIAWTDKPEQATPLRTIVLAREMLHRLNSSDDYKKIDFIIGALIESKTQFGVIFKRRKD